MPLISPANLPLLKVVLLLTLFVHFAWLGVMVGGATAAVVLDTFGTLDRRRHFRKLAAALLDRVGPGTGAVVLLCLTAALALLCVQIAYTPLAPSGAFLAGTLAPLLAGLALLRLYRQLLQRASRFPLGPGCGLAGITLTLLSCFLLCCGSGLLVMPEKWPLLSAMPQLLLSWSGTARYLEFTCLALAATGAVILPLAERTAEPDDARFTRRLGGGMALLFLLAWPPALLFGLFNLPAIALSEPLLVLASAGLVLAALLALLLLGALEQQGCRARPIFTLFLTLFALWMLADHLARENALDEATVAGFDEVIRTPAVGAGTVPAPMPAAPSTVGGPAAGGEEVFNRICTACHRFDTRLVGPPLNAVVPRYRDDLDGLKAFIRSPVKRDPAYPAMPQLGLTAAEVDAVARYLLERVAP